MHGTFEIQQAAYKPLYEKYHDEGASAIEPIERVKARVVQENGKYYFIVMDGARVGAVNVERKISAFEEGCFYISPIFVLPKYQNQGIKFVAMQKVFELYPDVKVWKFEPRAN